MLSSDSDFFESLSDGVFEASVGGFVVFPSYQGVGEVLLGDEAAFVVVGVAVAFAVA